MSYKVWSKDEVEMLYSSWGKLSIKEIGKRLGRSEVSVEIKARRLKLGSQIIEYGSTDIANILGIPSKTVYLYMKNGIIECRRDKTKMKRYMASEAQIMKFMKNHQDLWDTRNLTVNLYQRKPSWYKKKEERDKNIQIKKGKPWSDVEIKILVDRYRRNYTSEEIASEVGRTVKGVESKLRKINFGWDIII